MTRVRQQAADHFRSAGRDLAAGGLAYMVGTLFYGLKKLPYHHAVWHVLVMVGSTCHYFVVAGYVLP